MKKLIITIFFLLLVILFVSPVSASAETKAGISPGSFFYFFDTTFEKIGLFFTFSSEKKAQKNLEYANERLAEAEAVAGDKNSEAVKTAIVGYEKNIVLAAQSSKKVKDEVRSENLLTLIASSTSKHQGVLSAVLIKVPDEAKEAITRAIEVSKKGQEEALKQIAELKGEVEKLKKEVAELKAKQSAAQSASKRSILATKNSQEQKKSELTTLDNKPQTQKAEEKTIGKVSKQKPETKPKPTPTSMSIKPTTSQTSETSDTKTKTPSQSLIGAGTTNIEIRSINNGKIEISKRPSVGDFILKEKTNINGIISFRLYAKDNDVNIEGVKIKVGGSAPLSVINSVFATNGSGVNVTNQNSTLNEKGESILNFKLNIKKDSYYDLMIGAHINLNENENENKNIHMSVIGLVTSSEINGLPINGDVYTIKNQRLPKVTVNPGQVDTRHLFSAIKIISDKKVFLNSMKWYQSGNGGAENIKTYIDNISYEAISFDSKYFTSNFSGIVINPNETKEIYIKGDNISQYYQWLSFDIYRASDINITDENGNVIIPQAEQLWNYENSGGFRSINPWYDGYKVEMIE